MYHKMNIFQFRHREMRVITTYKTGIGEIIVFLSNSSMAWYHKSYVVENITMIACVKRGQLIAVLKVAYILWHWHLHTWVSHMPAKQYS